MAAVDCSDGGHGLQNHPKRHADHALQFLLATDCTDGAKPVAGLVQASDGNFYGTTEHGGILLSLGTVFRITLGGTLTTLHSFATTEGVYPAAGLVQAADGNFYGTTPGGGATGGGGTIFSLGVGSLSPCNSFR